MEGVQGTLAYFIAFSGLSREFAHCEKILINLVYQEFLCEVYLMKK